MGNPEGDLVPSEPSDTEFDEFELDAEDNFDEDLDSEEEEDGSDPANPRGESQELGNTALIELGNSHYFHSCSFCGSVEADSQNSSEWYIWAKFPVRPSQAPEECELFQFWRKQYHHVPDSASLYMGIELNNGRPSLGCRVVFSLAPSRKVWIQRDFLAGRIHPSESKKNDFL
jgi:hypothetical protein